MPEGRNSGKSSGYDPRQQAIKDRLAINSYQPAPTPPAPQYSPAPVYPTSSGQYSYPVAPPANNPGPVPDIGAFLGGDTGYQQQLRSLAQALSDFNADITRRRGSLESEYGLSKKALDDQRLLDLDHLEDDYGARGMITSGLYGKAVSDYEREFNQRATDLETRQKEALGLLEQESGKFKSQQELQTQAAREQAIRRRAEQFGL
jgi:hypothetical protein